MPKKGTTRRKGQMAKPSFTTTGQMAKPSYTFTNEIGLPLLLPKSYRPKPFSKEERAAIVAEKLRGAKSHRRPTAIITMGTPCSGKSTAIERIKGKLGDFVHIDPDEIRLRNDDYRALLNGEHYRARTGAQAQNARGEYYAYQNALENHHVRNLTRGITRRGPNSLLSRCIANRHNLIYDSLCQPLEKCQKTLINKLRRTHDIVILLVYSPRREVLRRARVRSRENGRYMNPAYVAETWETLWKDGRRKTEKSLRDYFEGQGISVITAP